MRRDAHRRAHCAVAIPWLAEALEDLEAAKAQSLRAPALEWFLGRSRPASAGESGWREWLLAHAPGAAGLLKRHAAGPCRRASAVTAGSMLEPPLAASVTTWACVEPVHLAAGIDRLRLEAPLNPPLDADDCRELEHTLNAVLEERGFRLAAIDQRRWLLASRDEIVCEACDPPEAAGRDIRDLMPHGRDGQAVRRLMNELQMVLHEHPVNERRAARGQPGANAVWLWGFGATNPAEPRRLPALAGDDEWLGDLWRLHDGDAFEMPVEALQRTGPGRSALIAWVDAAEPVTNAEARLARCERTVFAPLRAGVESGAVAEVQLLCGAQMYTLGRGERWSLWRRPRPLARRTP